MDFSTFKNLVIAKCEAMGITEYELYYQAAESTSIAAFQHEINQFTSSIEGGVCFRCIVNGKMGYASTESLSDEQAAAIVERAADNASVLEAEEPVFLGEGGKTYAVLPEEDKSARHRCPDRQGSGHPGAAVCSQSRCHRRLPDPGHC